MRVVILRYPAEKARFTELLPRRNDLINDSWMPDSGRELYKSVRAEERILEAPLSTVNR